MYKTLGIQCASAQSHTVWTLCTIPSKTISTLSTGNTGSDPSSKSRLPTSLRSSLFLQKTTKTFPLFNGQGGEEREISWECIRPETHSRGFLFFFSHSKEGKKFEKAKTKHTRKHKGKLNWLIIIIIIYINPIYIYIYIIIYIIYIYIYIYI